MITQEDVDGLDWYHTIKFRNGVISKGKSKYEGVDYDRFLIPEVNGRTVAELGTHDGFWAIECQKKGAVFIVAYDLFDLATARIALHDYGIRYSVGRDMNLLQSWPIQFHVVLFYGVIYHLVNPFQGLINAFNLTAHGGVLVVESEVFNHESESVPVLLVTPNGWAGDNTNHFIPNREGLRQMCRNLHGSQIVEESTVEQSKNRMTIKVSKSN